MMRQYVSRLL